MLAGRRKILALLACLLRRAPESVRRAELAALLWNDRNENYAKQSLRQALAELRPILGDALLADNDSVLVDAAEWRDRTNFDNTFISYYTWGSVIGLGLDLSLRERSDGKITLDDFMRALWDKHGRAGTRTPGYVETPYTIDDLKSALASVSRDAAFADDFFARYILGREIVDFRSLLSKAGLVLRLRAPGQAFAGSLRTQDSQSGVRVTDDVPFGSPAYATGLDREDIILSLGGTRIAATTDIDRALMTRKPGDSLQIVYERRGERITSVLKLIENPTLELVPAEEAGQTLTDVQRKFRESWLSSAARSF